MERDPYNEDISWLQQQEQGRYQEQIMYQDPGHYEQPSELPTPWSESPQQERYQRIQPIPRMPEGERQALIDGLKKGLLLSSLIGFGAFSWLVLSQAAPTISWQTSPGPSQFQPAIPSDHADGFFDQRGGRFFGHHHHHEDSEHWQNHDQNQNQFSGQGQDQPSAPVSGTHVSP